MRTSLFMNLVEILDVKWSQDDKQYSINLQKWFFTQQTKERKTYLAGVIV